jgi:hypothetical protein
VFAVAQARHPNIKVFTAHGSIKHGTLGGASFEAPGFYISFLSTLLFAMLRLRSLVLLLATVAGGVSALGPATTLDIVSKNIAPDGFPRP